MKNIRLDISFHLSRGIIYCITRRIAMQYISPMILILSHCETTECPFNASQDREDKCWLVNYAKHLSTI